MAVESFFGGAGLAERRCSSLRASSAPARGHSLTLCIRRARLWSLRPRNLDELHTTTCMANMAPNSQDDSQAFPRRKSGAASAASTRIRSSGILKTEESWTGTADERWDCLPWYHLRSALPQAVPSRGAHCCVGTSSPSCPRSFCLHPGPDLAEIGYLGPYRAPSYFLWALLAASPF